MLSRDAKKIIDTLVTARPLMLRAYPPNACIICTRIAVEMCRQRRIPATALPVSVKVENEIAETTLGFSEDGVAFGNVNIHLVVVIDRSRLLDLTIDQINDPTYGVSVSPVVLDVDKNFLAGRSSITTVQNGVTLTYTAHPEDKQHLTKEDWNDVPERERVMRLLN